MPLQDHFRPPLSTQRHWHAFHNAWATYLSSDLNQRLPQGYFAEPNVQFGIEIDVAMFEEAGATIELPTGGKTGRSAAGSYGTWTAPVPTLTVPISIITGVLC